MKKSNKNFLILGCGVTGSKIAAELSAFGNIFVSDLTGINKLKLPESAIYLKYSHDKNFINQITKKHEVIFDSVIHTHIQDINTATNFINQINSGVTKQVISLGTIMTYNQSTWAKIDFKKDFFWNEYQKQKKRVELLLQKHCDFQKINLFIPETFHILGAGYGVGISGPYFRMNQSELKAYKQLDSIQLSSNKPLCVIDNSDFARFIAYGAIQNLNGFYPIFNPNFINPKEYYSLLDKACGISRDIEINESLNSQPLCMNHAWKPNFETIQDFRFTPIYESILETVRYLEDPSYPNTRNISEIMSTPPKLDT